MVAPQVQGNQGSSANGAVNSNNDLMRITAGPTALASRMIYAMLTMYLTILKSQSKQKVNFYEAQLVETQGQANATVNAAKMQAYGLDCSAGLMIGGALASAGLNNVVGRSDYNKNTGKMNEVEAEGTQLKTINKMQPEAAGKTIAEGNTTTPTDKVQARMEELKNGEFLDGKNQDETDAAIQHMKANDPEGFVDMKRRLNEQITQRTQDMNSYAQKLQSITVNRQVYSQMASQIATAAGQFFQAYYKVQEANEQKDVDLLRTAGSQAGQGAGDLGQDMGKQYQNAMQALQALAAIRQSAETSNM